MILLLSVVMTIDDSQLLASDKCISSTAKGNNLLCQCFQVKYKGEMGFALILTALAQKIERRKLHYYLIKQKHVILQLKYDLL